MSKPEEPPLTHYWGSHACPAACGRMYYSQDLLETGHKVTHAVSEVTCPDCRATEAWLAQRMENALKAPAT